MSASQFAISVTDRHSTRDSVSVIVATYNRTCYLGECLESLLAQTHAPVEIIVVDDGSDEDVRATIAPYGERITYVRQDNAGRAAALNRGLEMARGEWLWCFDDDDVALPDSIARRLDAAHAQPGTELVLSEHYIGDDGPQGRIRRERRIDARCKDIKRLLVDTLRNHLFLFQGTLIHRSCFERVGLFDTTLLRSADYELTVRLLRQCKAAILREPTFVWRDHSGARGPKALRHDEAQRRKVWLEYDGRIGRRIRATVQLGEYLVPAIQDRPLTPHEARYAMLTRMTVMASKGLVDEALDDLRVAADMDRDAGLGRLTPNERKLCTQAMTHPFWLARIVEDPAGFIAKLSARSSTPLMRMLAGCLARGLLHAARKSARVARRVVLWRVSLRLAALAGPRPLLNAYFGR